MSWAVLLGLRQSHRLLRLMIRNMTKRLDGLSLFERRARLYILTWSRKWRFLLHVANENMLMSKNFISDGYIIVWVLLDIKCWYEGFHSLVSGLQMYTF